VSQESLDAESSCWPKYEWNDPRQLTASQFKNIVFSLFSIIFIGSFYIIVKTLRYICYSKSSKMKKMDKSD